MEIRDTRYAKTTDGVYVAYQTAGEGPLDAVWQFDAFGNVDLIWEEPFLGTWARGLAGFSRVILHDRRGTGLSSRNVPPPNLETRVSDLRLVLDTVGSDRPVLVGMNEGGAANILFAATNPERVRSIVWVKPLPRVVWTPDFPWGVKPEYVEHDQRALDLWGTNDYGAAWAETEATEGETLFPEGVRLAGVMSRHTATPDVARELARIWYETDVRGVLQSVQAPTLLLVREGSRADVEAAEYVASLMPDAAVARVASFEPDELGPVIDAVRVFLGAEPPAPELDTILSTVLFTDIVGSTEKQASLGNRGWKDLVERHHAIVREGIARWRGVENDTAGDGFYATFDGPARAIRCAQEVTERVSQLGIEVRAGVHTGECEVIDGKMGGIAVTIGSRVAATAEPSEVRISQTVKDLVAGSGLTFEDAGEYELKGVPDRWHLYRVASGQA
jgi:class 3 adenylate cyclase/pimeloyl-ACP methyl ester carboxylesterase